MAADLPSSKETSFTPANIRETGNNEESEHMENTTQTDIDKLQELQRCKSWLDEQQIDCNTQLIKCRLDQEQALQPFSSVHDISSLNDTISELQKELINCSARHSYFQHINDSLLAGDTLIKTLFPHIIMDNPGQEQINSMNEFARLCERNNELCSTILDHHKELKETQQKLDEIKLKNFEIKAENRELMSQLKTLTENRNHRITTDDDAVKGEERRYHQTNSKLHLTANIFQALIVASGINWAADDRTRELVVSLGEM